MQILRLFTPKLAPSFYKHPPLFSYMNQFFFAVISILPQATSTPSFLHFYPIFISHLSRSLLLFWHIPFLDAATTTTVLLILHLSLLVSGGSGWEKCVVESLLLFVHTYPTYLHTNVCSSNLLPLNSSMLRTLRGKPWENHRPLKKR